MDVKKRLKEKQENELLDYSHIFSSTDDLQALSMLPIAHEAKMAIIHEYIEYNKPKQEAASETDKVD